MTKIESSRKGAAIITMVLVLGGLSIALMALALQTQLQMKAMRNSASQQQQYNELIEFGEIILQSRLESAVSNLGAEPIVVSLPSSLANVSNLSAEAVEIRFTQMESSEKLDPAHWHWTIHIAAAGSRSGVKSEAVKTITFRRLPDNSHE
jgi:hypothetical protein